MLQPENNQDLELIGTRRRERTDSRCVEHSKKMENMCTEIFE